MLQLVFDEGLVLGELVHHSGSHLHTLGDGNIIHSDKRQKQSQKQREEGNQGANDGILGSVHVSRWGCWCWCFAFALADCVDFAKQRTQEPAMEAVTLKLRLTTGA